MNDPVSWLYGLQNSGVKLGLDGIRGLLSMLAHPEDAYPSALVAGTNGKGSTAATLDALLAAHGIRSGLFTSPHLVRPNERIRIAGEDVSDVALGALLSELRDRIGAALRDGRLDAQPSFFETITAAALESFRRAEVGAAVLEVGLGGRLDATNAVEPRVSVIVGIDLDHTAVLGGTLAAIAAEKAGVARRGRPLVSGATRPEARGAIEAASARVGAHLVDALAVTSAVAAPHGAVTVRTPERTYAALRPALAGAHQVHNLRVALVAFEAFAADLGVEVRPEAVARGVRAVRWPGRLQRLPGDPALLLDGAHNPAGAEALGAELARRGGPPAVLLFATMRDKDEGAMLAPLAPHVDAVVVTRPGVLRAAEAEDLAARVSAALPGTPVTAEPDVRRALEEARALARARGTVVLVAGSLYLVGEVLGALEGRPVPGPVSM